MVCYQHSHWGNQYKSTKREYLAYELDIINDELIEEIDEIHLEVMNPAP